MYPKRYESAAVDKKRYKRTIHVNMNQSPY